MSNKDSDDGNHSSIDRLIDSMEEETNGNEKRLDSLVKTLKDQNNQIRISKMKNELKQFDEVRNKKGEEFWFPETTVQEPNAMEPKLIVSDTEDADLINSSSDPHHGTDDMLDEGEQMTPSIKKKPLEIGELKQQIDDERDNRSVSRLMSALIDDIDESSEKAEESFKKLLSAFSKNESEQRHSSPRNQQRKFRKGKQHGTFFNEPTNLFGTYKEIKGTTQEIGDFTSLHEIQWKENLQNLLPESVPENMFEVKMLEIDREWRYPIDNEQDMGIEDVTSFEEHVFLDHYLDEFPHEGPVRKFMELVITGLQQNPYLTVEEKTSRILWFKQYFEKFPDEELMISMED